MRIADVLLHEKGRKIYESKRESLTKKYPGKCVAINIETKRFYISDNPEEALEKAKKANPNCVPYITKIGPD